MGNNTSRVVGCFVPFNGKRSVDLEFLEPSDEGLGHSFCYVRPSIFDSPAITPSNSERFTVDSSTLDSETFSGSFRHDTVEDSSTSAVNKSQKSFPETTFKTISGASVSANVSTVRSGDIQSTIFASDIQEPASSFESTSSFASIPLQPIPRNTSEPMSGFFMSGPLERGFASGPLDRGGCGFMSGPMEKGVMSGPLDATDKSNFSAPLAVGRQRPGLQRLMRSVSGPMRKTLSRNFSRCSVGSGWMQRFFFHPVSQLVWHPKESKFRSEVSRIYLDGGPSEGVYRNTQNLQWAHGKAGEDRVHIVLSEEQGWLFIGIYDGFSGPDAPDFLMTHLYKAIDKELEELPWDYEDKLPNDSLKPEVLKTQNPLAGTDYSTGEQQSPLSSQLDSLRLEGSYNPGRIIKEQSSNCEIVEENDVGTRYEQHLPNSEKPNISDAATICVQAPSLTGQGRKSMQLFELLQMEPRDGHYSSVSISDGRNLEGALDSREAMQEEQRRSSLLNAIGDTCSAPGDDPTATSRDGDGRGESSNQGVLSSHPGLGKRQKMRASSVNSKLRKMYQKQKSMHKKLFPWIYDWHREEGFVDERIIAEPSGPIRRSKSGGVVDHDAALRAMARALERTEEAYMEMVEKALDKNPELALMGSCVLVMLMKDQDVYVMNIGDSRVILAQERPIERHTNHNFLKDDIKHRNRSRESLVRMELDRISEESPIHNKNSQVNKINKNREISICRLKMRAVQLSTDHSTSVEEEVLRIRAEHPDDNQAILNDRLKGQLKVTRALGAGFLKRPTCNEALLEMFRVDYVGTAPYLSCIPSVLHHRLTSSDRFLVLSSDGLYQYFSNEEVVAHVTWFMENIPEGDPAQYLIAELLFRAAKKYGMGFHELLDIPQGDRRKYHDDVSVIVVSLEGRIWRSSG